MAVIVSWSFNSLGKSLKLCTAKSILPSMRAVSNSFVNIPLASILYNCEFLILSPVVLIILVSISSPVISSRAFTTVSVYYL